MEAENIDVEEDLSETKVIEDAILKHGFVGLDPKSKDQQGLVRYVFNMGYNSGYKSARKYIKV